MVRVLRWLPVVAFVLVLPVVADDETKKPSEPAKKEEMKKDAPEAKPKPEPKPEPKAKTPDKKYDELTTIQGRLKKIDSKTSELHVEHMVGFGKGAKKLTEELTLSEDLKVLTRIIPEEVGDDGKAKRISGAELAKLKDPNPKFKGLYTTDINHLQPNQMVEVVVGRLKENAPKKSAKGKPDDKEGLVVIRVIIMSDDRMNSAGKDKSAGKTPPKKP